MSHTPGPWKYEKRNGMAGRYHPFNVSANFYSTPGCVDGRDQIAEIVSPKEHAEANARLIAASPRLLEACKALLITMENMKIDRDDDFLAPEIQLLQDVIAEAETL